MLFEEMHKEMGLETVGVEDENFSLDLQETVFRHPMVPLAWLFVKKIINPTPKWK